MRRRDFLASVAAASAVLTTPARAADRFPYRETSIEALRARMDAGRLTARTLAAACLARIEAIDRNGPRLNSVIELNPDALEIAGVEQLADSAIVIRCRMKTLPAEQWRVRREFLKRLKNAFDREGISIPYPHRMLVQEPIPARGDRDTLPTR